MKSQLFLSEKTKQFSKVGGATDTVITKAVGHINSSSIILVIKNLVPFYHTPAMRLRIGIIHSDKNPMRVSSTFPVCTMISKAITRIYTMLKSK